jgi:hypothetical protein
MRTIDTSIMDRYMSMKKAKEYSRRVERMNRAKLHNKVENIKVTLGLTIVLLLAMLVDTIMFQAGMF